MSTPDDADSRRAFHVGMGMASPLWPAFMAMAGAGAMVWWWSQWTRGRTLQAAVQAAPPIGLHVHPGRPGDQVDHSLPGTVAETAAEPGDHSVDQEAETDPRNSGGFAVDETGQGLSNDAVQLDDVMPAPAAAPQPPPVVADLAPAPATTPPPPDTEGATEREAPRAPASEAATSAPPVDSVVVTPLQHSDLELEALAAEPSVAALTGGEAMDQTVGPAQTLTETLSVQGESGADPKPKARGKAKSGPTADAHD